jgi:transposase
MEARVHRPYHLHLREAVIRQHLHIDMSYFEIASLYHHYRCAKTVERWVLEYEECELPAESRKVCRWNALWFKKLEDSTFPCGQT